MKLGVLLLIVYSCDEGYHFTGLSSSFDSGWLGLDSLQHPQGDYGLQSVVCCRSYLSLVVILVHGTGSLRTSLACTSRMCHVYFQVSHSKTKIKPETVSVDSLVFVKLIVVWSESSNPTQSIVATCHNELKKENWYHLRRDIHCRLGMLVLQ